jgi:hypothetical protein
MKRLCVLALLLLLAGCSAEDQQKWHDAWDDWNGKNMEMRSGPSRFKSSDD